MADPKMIEWIRAQQAQGFTPDQIRQYMYQLGYQQQAVEEAIGQAFTPIKSGGSKVLVITAGVVLLIILIIAAIFMLVGEDEQQREEDRLMEGESTISEATQSTSGITPEQLKSNILSSYINIRNYGFTIEEYIEKAHIPGQEELTKVSTSTSDGVVETKDKRVYAHIGIGARGSTIPISPLEFYMVNNEVYYNVNDTWLKETPTNPNDYYELKKAIEIIQDSTIILIQDDGSQIRVVLDNNKVGEEIVESVLGVTGINPDDFNINYETAIQDADIICWVDEEWRITKITYDITITLNEETAPKIDGVNHTLNYNIKLSSTTEFSGYNTQSPITLPEMAKTAKDITPGPGYAEGTGGGGETDWKRSTTFIYGSGQPYNPKNPVSVVEEHADAINSTDVQKYRKTTRFHADMTDSDLMALLTEKKNNLFLDKVEVFYCEDVDTGQEVNCENPGNAKKIRVHIKGKKGGKTVQTTITLINEDGTWVDDGSFIEQDHDQMNNDQENDGTTDDNQDDIIDEGSDTSDDTNPWGDEIINLGVEWSNETNETNFGEDYDYQKGKPYNAQNPLTVFDAYATAVINLDPDGYRAIVATELDIDTDDLPPEWEGFTDSGDVDLTQFPDEALVQYLNTTKMEFLETGYYKVLYCKNVMGTEENCEVPKDEVDTMVFTVEIKKQGELGQMRRTVVRESTGWKIM